MFIVLEGLDGAGKSTQIKRLAAWLAAQGRKVEHLHFPRFDTPVYGELIARFLRGELGAVRDVNPYLVALLYAGDRQAAAPTIRRWMAEGRAVIVDRYVVSNIAYQCAKLTDSTEQAALREWILDLEYNLHAIPAPERTLFLDVPFAFTERSLTGGRTGAERDYLQGKADIHERSLALQRAVGEVYRAEAALDPSFRIVDCSADDGSMLAPDAIFERIKQEL